MNMLHRMVPLMREACGPQVVIIIRFDSGFFDEAILRTCDELQVGVIMTGKMYETINTYVWAQDPDQWAVYANGHQEWEYLEFGWRCKSWGTTLPGAIHTSRDRNEWAAPAGLCPPR